MSDDEQSQLDQLWQEYGSFLKGWDDLSLARWMAQTLAQLSGKSWRLSHPLVGVYRLAAMESHQRGLRLARLAQIPHDYPPAPCCGNPLLPLVTRDVAEDGMLCSHCNGKALALEELPRELETEIRTWSERYAEIHAVAHWNETQKQRCKDYEQAYNDAAQSAEEMLSELGKKILPQGLDHYPAVIWEDHDECLDIRADDLTE